MSEETTQAPQAPTKQSIASRIRDAKPIQVNPVAAFGAIGAVAIAAILAVAAIAFTPSSEDRVRAALKDKLEEIDVKEKALAQAKAETVKELAELLSLQEVREQAIQTAREEASASIQKEAEILAEEGRRIASSLASKEGALEAARKEVSTLIREEAAKAALLVTDAAKEAAKKVSEGKAPEVKIKIPDGEAPGPKTAAQAAGDSVTAKTSSPAPAPEAGEEEAEEEDPWWKLW